MNGDLIVVALVSLDWYAHGDEWMTRFGDQISDQSTQLLLTGYRYDGTTQPHIQLSITTTVEPRSLFNLYVTPLADKRFLLGVSSENELPEPLIQAWFDAANNATENIGKGGPLYEWSAIIGPPTVHLGDGEVGIQKPGQFGPFTFKPSERPLVEFSPSVEMPSLAGGGLYTSMPILVRGSHNGYSWQAASEFAARDLNRACGLLSVAWNTCITIRDSPAPLDWGIRTVPERIPWLSTEFRSASQSIPSPTGKIPDWADDAWSLMENKPRITDAVAAFQEGLRAELAHPSLALVAFIASIEGVSQLLFREEKCGECKSHRHISAKFRETLRLVLDAQEADELGSAYSPRSNTVHRGQLHGHESIIGSLRRSAFWEANGTHSFQWRILHGMRNASRRVLLLALKDGLPPKRRLNES